MTNDAPKVLNITVYNTDDILAVIDGVFKEREAKQPWKTYKIRYLIKPTGWRDKKKWATLERSRRTDELVIALLRPDKVGDGLLDALACCNDTEAHPRIVKDLLAETKRMIYSRKKLEFTPAAIRINKEIDATAQQISAYRNLALRVRVKTRKLADRKVSLSRMQAEVAAMEASLPEEEVVLTKLRARLIKSTYEIGAKGLLS